MILLLVGVNRLDPTWEKTESRSKQPVVKIEELKHGWDELWSEISGLHSDRHLKPCRAIGHCQIPNHFRSWNWTEKKDKNCPVSALPFVLSSLLPGFQSKATIRSSHSLQFLSSHLKHDDRSKQSWEVFLLCANSTVSKCESVNSHSFSQVFRPHTASNHRDPLLWPAASYPDSSELLSHCTLSATFACFLASIKAGGALRAGVTTR